MDQDVSGFGKGGQEREEGVDLFIQPFNHCSPSSQCHSKGKDHLGQAKQQQRPPHPPVIGRIRTALQIIPFLLLL